MEGAVNTAAEAAGNPSSFLLRRLHSLSGIIPIGGFMLFHFFENASARTSPEAFNETVVKISKMPYLPIMEIFLLAIPILFHAFYGLFIRTPSKMNLGSYSTARNWAYFFQRVTGIIAFFYIIFHVATTRVWAIMVKGDHITFQDMASSLANPMVALIYIIGILAITFHFCNGIWSFSITWGLVTTKVAQERLAALSFGFFIILATIGLDIFSAFILEKSLIYQLIGF